MKYDDFLNKYIPSVDTKTVIRETGHIFSDSDKATIIWNSDKSLSERLKDLKTISDETSDDTLRTEIQERLALGEDDNADWDNKRFENKYVVFPEVFCEHEKVCLIQDTFAYDEIVGWISRAYQSYEEIIKHATEDDSRCDYTDVQYRVDYWDEDNLTWNHLHINPIYLERVHEKLCNSFDDDPNRQVIIGHDIGAALWIRVADVKESDRIMYDDVTEIGMEISVHESFFDEVIRPIFVDVFDAEMLLNKNRFTYGLRDEGQYLTCFEERILEYNFFTYDQMNEIVERLERAEDIQIVTLAAHIRHIMDEYPERSVISVLS